MVGVPLILMTLDMNYGKIDRNEFKDSLCGVSQVPVVGSKAVPNGVMSLRHPLEQCKIINM